MSGFRNNSNARAWSENSSVRIKHSKLMCMLDVSMCFLCEKKLIAYERILFPRKKSNFSSQYFHSNVTEANYLWKCPIHKRPYFLFTCKMFYLYAQIANYMHTCGIQMWRRKVNVISCVMLFQHIIYMSTCEHICMHLIHLWKCPILMWSFSHVKRVRVG